MSSLPLPPPIHLSLGPTQHPRVLLWHGLPCEQEVVPSSTQCSGLKSVRGVNAQESLNQSLAAVAVSSGKPVASPFAEACTINSQQSAPTAQTCGARPATPGGFVQTSSGRIARPTPKTAASRASSGDLSELFHTEGAPLMWLSLHIRPR